MTKTNETYEILICSDCAVLYANGEVPEDPETEAKVLAAAGVDEGWTVVLGDAEKDHEFSWSACDTCRSHLGGYRFHAYTWER